MIDEMRESLLESVDQPGVSIQEVKEKDRRRRGWDSGLDYNQEEAFIMSAKQFKEMLDEMLLDPVVRSQIDDHLEFTKKVWPYEFGDRFVVGSPLIINYYMLSKMSKGIALTEYEAIEYILHH